MTSRLERLEDVARQARTWRLAGVHHDGRTAEFPLVGYCFDNAYVLWHLLERKGFDAYIVAGTTERVADELIADGFEPREFEQVTDLAGLVHYWVEVETDSDEVVYVDIASDSFNTLGECLVVRDLPNDYIRLPDSKEYGEETRESACAEDLRCTYCGNHRYLEGGCPRCHDIVAEDI